MNLSGFMLKLNTILSSGAGRLSSLVAAESKIQNTFDAATVTSAMFTGFFTWIVNFVVKIIYIVCQFILNIIEIFELTINRLLGINIELSDYAVVDTSNPIFKVLTNETFLKVFRYVLGVSIVLVIAFTIFALIRSEYAFATDDGQAMNSKTNIFKRMFKSLFVMGFFPVVILASVILINAVLAGFNNILKSNERTTIAAQIFATSAYSANNYRNYANGDTRIPIVINFDDPVKNGQTSGYAASELAEYYKRFQKKGAAIYDDFADKNFGSFSDTLVYKNNRLYNKSEYSGFEKFVCTKEQYMVMADFIDYAVKHNLKYYVKNMKDDDINWKWVDESIFDKETQTLMITYKDTSNISGGETYTVWYTPTSMDISTPIGDAVRTLSALLGVGEYEDNNFDVLKRLEDSINVVEWETARVFLQLSSNYKETPTTLDQLLLYEQARWEYNNTLNFSLSELEDGTDDLPVYKVTKRQYQASTGKYVVTDELYAVRINGTFYEVQENPDLKDEAGNYRRDSFGDPYYTLVETGFGLVKASDLKNIDAEYYGYEYQDADGNTHTDKVSKANDIVEVVTGTEYYKSHDSFKDIIITILNGTYEEVLENNLIANVSYNDTYERVIKQTSWPKKLINDLQVIYKDINFNHLLTTGDWLKNLGEYVGSQNKSEDYGSSIQTGFIHPLGLILAEMFLGQIDPADEFNIYSSLEYNSKFDDETVKAFILSMLGEDKYYQLSEELKYFEEIFNIFMGPVLDEISYYENFDLLSGNEQSIQLYTYKAYLASVLLSSNSANWFYETASSMLGINAFLADLVGSDGCYKSFNDLKSENKDMLRNLLDNGKKMLKSTQSLEPGDKGYPEYMKVLDAYINGDESGYYKNYFEGRLKYILKSNKSDEKKAEDIDSAKGTLKDEYQNLETLVESNPDFQGVFDAFIKDASSEYKLSEDNLVARDFYDNLTTLVQVQEEKDRLGSLLDNLNNAMAEKDEDGAIKKDEDGNIAYLDLYKENASEFIEKVEDYRNASEKYLELKEDYYTPDNSASLIGQHDGLINERDGYLNQAIEFYNNYINFADENIEGVKSNDIKLWAPYETEEASGWDSFWDGVAEFFTGKPINELKYVKPTSDLSKLKEYTENLKIDHTGDLAKLYDKFTKEEDKETVKDLVNRYVTCIEQYIETQEKFDRLNRYEIVFAVRSLVSEGVSKLAGASQVPLEFDVVLSNKHYTVGQNFTRAKFIEYVLGASYLKSEGYDTLFVSDDYDGMITLEYKAFDDTSDTSYTYMTNTNGDVVKFRTYNGEVSKFKVIESYDKDGKKQISYTPYTNGVYVEVTAADTDEIKNSAKYLGYRPVDAFKEVREFAIEIGQMSAELYQMTNLINLSKSTKDDLIVGQYSYTDNGTTYYRDLAKQILLTVAEKEMLGDNWVKALFEVDETGITENQDATTGKITYTYDDTTYDSKSDILAIKAVAKANVYTSAESNKKFNEMFAYLLMTDPDSTKREYVDYSVMTLKEIRKKCLSALVNFEQQQGDTVEQNQKRYLAILQIACGDWQTTVTVINDDKSTSQYKLGADDGSWATSRLKDPVTFEISNQSMGTILRLAGLENRPYEDLVGAEYSIDFDFGGVDEKNGDIFIICTFDEETRTYVPFMMANKYEAQGRGLKIADDENTDENTWYKKFGYYYSYTDTYASPIPDPKDDNEKYVYYPIIARGIVYSDGMPTAIREVDGNIEYYRDDIVIRDASDIGLETYYLSMDSVTVHHSLVSSIVNGFSKIFTGKTLAEHLATSIPRFAAHTDYNFCYGVDETVKFTSPEGGTSLSFNLNMTSDFASIFKIDCIYEINKLNVLILLIGTITIVSALWKALWGVVGRIIDIAIDVLIGPAVIATINLRYDKISEAKGETKFEEVGFNSYDSWKNKTQNDLLSVFAYAIGFNIFFIVVPVITGLVLFKDASAFANLPLINGLSVDFLNEISRLIFLVGAAYLTKRAPDLFAQISGTGNGFASGEKVLGSVKNTINTVQDVVSGQEFIDKMSEAKENAINMIPGFNGAKNAAKKMGRKKAADRVYKQARNNFINQEKAEGRYGKFADKLTARAKARQQAQLMKKTLEDEYAKEEKLKAKRKEEREKRNQARQEWMNN